MPFEKCFIGKKVIITGAGKGLGRGLAIRLHNYGATVFALSKTEETLISLKEQCPNVITHTVDISDWDTTRDIVSKIGPVDHLINNAALCKIERFFDVSPNSFDVCMNIGLKAGINISQVVAKGMIDAGIKGSIVNISSLASTNPFPTVFVYSIMKAGVDAMTKLMALELGPHGIRVNAINTAGIKTDLQQKFFDGSAEDAGVSSDALEEGLNLRSPIRKFTMSMDDAVNSVLFPLSNLSQLLHGECIVVDGGISLT